MQNPDLLTSWKGYWPRTVLYCCRRPIVRSFCSTTHFGTCYDVLRTAAPHVVTIIFHSVRFDSIRLKHIDKVDCLVFFEETKLLLVHKQKIKILSNKHFCSPRRPAGRLTYRIRAFIQSIMLFAWTHCVLLESHIEYKPTNSHHK